jgi:hypothetical protein
LKTRGGRRWSSFKAFQFCAGLKGIAVYLQLDDETYFSNTVIGIIVSISPDVVG